MKVVLGECRQANVDRIQSIGLILLRQCGEHNMRSWYVNRVAAKQYVCKNLTYARVLDSKLDTSAGIYPGHLTHWPLGNLNATIKIQISTVFYLLLSSDLIMTRPQWVKLKHPEINWLHDYRWPCLIQSHYILGIIHIAFHGRVYRGTPAIVMVIKWTVNRHPVSIHGKTAKVGGVPRVNCSGMHYGFSVTSQDSDMIIQLPIAIVWSLMAQRGSVWVINYRICLDLKKKPRFKQSQWTHRVYSMIYHMLS